VPHSLGFIIIYLNSTLTNPHPSWHVGPTCIATARVLCCSTCSNSKEGSACLLWLWVGIDCCGFSDPRPINLSPYAISYKTSCFSTAAWHFLKLSMPLMMLLLLHIDIVFFLYKYALVLISIFCMAGTWLRSIEALLKSSLRGIQDRNTIIKLCSQGVLFQHYMECLCIWILCYVLYELEDGSQSRTWELCHRNSGLTVPNCNVYWRTCQELTALKNKCFFFPLSLAQAHC
jgi:hypothetical protein